METVGHDYTDHLSKKFSRGADHENPKGVNHMDYLAVFRAKVSRFREEIADIQRLNQQFRRSGENGAAVQIAHGLRSERLQAIQHELGQLAHLGSRPISTGHTQEEQHSPTHIEKRKRAA
jgi:hypothetical protein